MRMRIVLIVAYALFGIGLAPWGLLVLFWIAFQDQPIRWNWQTIGEALPVLLILAYPVFLAGALVLSFLLRKLERPAWVRLLPLAIPLLPVLVAVVTFISSP
jgi:hypothetical protein